MFRIHPSSVRSASSAISFLAVVPRLAVWAVCHFARTFCLRSPLYRCPILVRERGHVWLGLVLSHIVRGDIRRRDLARYRLALGLGYLRSDRSIFGE